MSCFIRGDALKTLKSQIKSKSIDLIYFDPPFGTTRQVWDEKQDWPAIFTECFRVLKDRGMLVIHCSIPFNYELIRAAPKPPSHSWYWLKESPTCPLIANQQPLRQVEEILVWKNKRNAYYRQQIGDEPRVVQNSSGSDYYMRNIHAGEHILRGKTRSHFLNMRRSLDGFSTRPKEMIQLMIDSYSQAGDTVLDLFCYKGISSTCCAGRKWIGIDKNFYPMLLDGLTRGS